MRLSSGYQDTSKNPFSAATGCEIYCASLCSLAESQRIAPRIQLGGFRTCYAGRLSRIHALRLARMPGAAISRPVSRQN
jgi:hypothetical protein